MNVLETLTQSLYVFEVLTAASYVTHAELYNYK